MNKFFSNYDDFLLESKKNQGEILVIFGPPGSGKGTLSEKLADRNGLKHVSSGELLRDSGREDLLKRMNSGKLVPDREIIKIIRKNIKNHDFSEGIIFDGFPRSVKQAKMLDSMLGKMGLGLSHAIYLDLSEKESRERISKRAKDSGRKDDSSSEVLDKRFEEYRENTLPVLEFYKRSRKSIKIDASGGSDDVYKKVVKRLGLRKN